MSISCQAEIVARLRLSSETTLHVVKIDGKLVAVSESGISRDGHPSVSTSIAQLFNYSDLVVGEIKKDLNGQS